MADTGSAGVAEDVSEPREDEVISVSDSSEDSNPPEVKPKPRKTPPPRPPPPRFSSVQDHLNELCEIRPQRVRWFVYEDKKWVPFSGYDSLAIETCFRRIKEFEESSGDTEQTSVVYELATVKGGLFEVDVVARECKPIYWKEASMKVCRGTWFMGGATPEQWLPVEEEDASQIEFSHQALWTSIGFASKEVLCEDDVKDCNIEKQVLGRLDLKGQYVEWRDMTDVWLHKQDATSKFLRGVGERLGYTAKGTQLHRGYHTESTEDDQLPQITHLVFVVHGIGQLMHVSNVNRSSSEFRKVIAKVAERYYPNLPSDQRVEFLPIEWRSSLKLDEGTIHSITPTTVPGIREMLNSSMMDIMYYTSPFYRSEIIEGVRDELNAIYTMFCERNPQFIQSQGKVSILAHSLGSVITYDILSQWDIEVRHLEGAAISTGFISEVYNYFVPDSGRSRKSSQLNPGSVQLMRELAEARVHVAELEGKVHSQQVSGTKDGRVKGSSLALKFKVEYLFNIGSPLGVFLTLRGMRPHSNSENYIVPRAVCKRMYNIYHPLDPVAYRLEPLINAHYSSIEPVQIQRYDTNAQYESKEIVVRDTGRSSSWLRSWFNSYQVVYAQDTEKETEDGLKDTEDAATTSQPAANQAADPSLKRTESEQEKARRGWMSGWFSQSEESKRRLSSTEDLHRPHTIRATEGQESIDGETEEQADDKKGTNQGLTERMDYTLKEGYVESRIYYGTLTSHVSYWTSFDLAKFLMHIVYETSCDDKPVQPHL